MSQGESYVSILVAEDDALLREFLLERLASERDFSVVGCVGSGREAVNMLTQVRPHVLLLDLGLSELSGLKVLEQVANQDNAPGVLVLSGDETEETQLDAARWGARGFLGKSRAGAVLAEAIRTIAAGGVWLSPELVTRIVTDYPTLVRRAREQTNPVSHLTEREREVLVQMAQGKTNKQIAADLFMSISTVKLHVRNVFKKLNLPNRAGAAVFAVREGLLDSPTRSSPQVV